MAKQNFTADGSSSPWSIRDGLATLYLAGTFDGATVAVEFKVPWGAEWIADSRFAYTEPTVDVIEVGDAASVRLTVSSAGASTNINADVTG